MELYVNRRKVDMLQDPLAYLLERNKALLDTASGTATACTTCLNNIVKAVTGIRDKNDPAYVAASKQLCITWFRGHITYSQKKGQ